MRFARQWSPASRAVMMESAHVRFASASVFVVACEMSFFSSSRMSDACCHNLPYSLMTTM